MRSGKTVLEDAALIGLGAGSLAAYAQPGQHFTFYESFSSPLSVLR